jgi:hypothetical protein
MPDAQQSSRALSEIGHLFLSSVRERQMQGAKLPRRYPPGSRSPLPAEQSQDVTSAAEPRFPQVSALLAGHLSDHQSEHVHQYANHLAARGLRVGLIEMDSATLRVTTFESSADDEPSSTTEKFEARTVSDVLAEMSWDLDRWLLVLPSGRNWEAKCLLRDVGHWVLLSKCDHDGVINCYRMLKGLNPGGEDWPRPRLSLALLDSQDTVEAERVHRKLAGVCEQFLAMPLEAEPAIGPMNRAVLERCVSYEIQPAENRSGGIGPQWQVIADFLAKNKSAAAPELPQEIPAPEKMVERVKEPMQNQMHSPMPISEPMQTTTEQRPMAPAAGMRLMADKPMDAVSDVIDLPDGNASTESIIAAVLACETAGLMECPITVPRCPEAKLVVSRDRRLTLLAVKAGDTADLRPIAQAYQWMCENRKLIAMACRNWRSIPVPNRCCGCWWIAWMPIHRPCTQCSTGPARRCRSIGGCAGKAAPGCSSKRRKKTPVIEIKNHMCPRARYQADPSLPIRYLKHHAVRYWQQEVARWQCKP